MSELGDSPLAIGPGCRVAVLPSDAASGATIGYYGTIVGVCRTASFPIGQPACFWVDVPALHGVVHVRAVDLLVITECEGEERLVSAADEVLVQDAMMPCRIEFRSPVEQDNNELWGEYYVGSAARGTFRFMKSGGLCNRYQLSIPAEPGRPPIGRLRYTVSQSRLLDRHFVQEAIPQVLGIRAAGELTDV